MNAAEVRRFVAAVQSAAPSPEDKATIAEGLRVLRNDDGALVVAADLGAGGPASEVLGLPWEISEAEWLDAFRRVREPALSFIGAAANEGRS